MSGRALTIAVTGLDARDNPHPGIPVARALRAGDLGRPLRLVGLTYDVRCTGAYCDELFDRVYLMPYPSAYESLQIARLEKIHAGDPLDLLIPTLDSEIAIIARARTRLAELGIRTLLPSESSIKKRGKEQLPSFCARRGFATPETRVITTLAQLGEPGFARRFPFYLKSSIVDAALVHSLAEAREAYQRLLHDWGYPILMQERVEGDEFNVSLVADHEHRVVASLQVRKFGITSKGKGFASIVVALPELDDLARRIVKELQWVGPAELEFVRERGSQRFPLIEMNARFPAWVALSGECGQNLPEVAVRLALGEGLRAQPAADPGTMYVRNIHSRILPITRLARFMVEGYVE